MLEAIQGQDDTGPLRVAIVGTGAVGSTFAYALLLSGLASEIVLIDVNKPKAEGEAMDLNHAVPFTHPTRIWAGDYSDCAQAALTVLAAGVPQKRGQTRLECVQANARVWHEMIPQIAKNNRRGIFLVATNPVDVLTYAAWKISGLPASRVLGSGRFWIRLASGFC
jgi:L-lactate dehydrogenase